MGFYNPQQGIGMSIPHFDTPRAVDSADTVQKILDGWFKFKQDMREDDLHPEQLKYKQELVKAQQLDNALNEAMNPIKIKEEQRVADLNAFLDPYQRKNVMRKDSFEEFADPYNRNKLVNVDKQDNINLALAQMGLDSANAVKDFVRKNYGGVDPAVLELTNMLKESKDRLATNQANRNYYESMIRGNPNELQQQDTSKQMTDEEKAKVFDDFFINSTLMQENKDKARADILGMPSSAMQTKEGQEELSDMQAQYIQNNKGNMERMIWDPVANKLYAIPIEYRSDDPNAKEYDRILKLGGGFDENGIPTPLRMNYEWSVDRRLPIETYPNLPHGIGQVTRIDPKTGKEVVTDINGRGLGWSKDVYNLENMSEKNFTGNKFNKDTAAAITGNFMKDLTTQDWTGGDNNVKQRLGKAFQDEQNGGLAKELFVLFGNVLNTNGDNGLDITNNTRFVNSLLSLITDPRNKTARDQLLSGAGKAFGNKDEQSIKTLVGLTEAYLELKDKGELSVSKADSSITGLNKDTMKPSTINSKDLSRNELGIKLPYLSANDISKVLKLASKKVQENNVKDRTMTLEKLRKEEQDWFRYD